MNEPVFIIAEAGVNHNGNLDMALQLIDAAQEAGVDAVKFQSFKPEQLVAANAPKANYQQAPGDGVESQQQMLAKLAISEADHHRLFTHCQERGITFLSTPFDTDSLNFLTRELGLRQLKLSSGAVTHGPLLLAAGQSGADLILSSGLSSLGDVEQALMVLAFALSDSPEPPSLAAFTMAYNSAKGQQLLAQKIQLLHCTSQYPTPLVDVNLRAIDTMRGAFGLRVGFSDHSRGITAPIAAVARGAGIIEKHFTLDNSLPGPDHKASLEPAELKSMVTAIREVEEVLGSGQKGVMASELENREVVRASLTALKNIAAGALFTTENLGVKRPGTGISPIHYWSWLGRVAGRDFAKDEIIE